ncbi:MAG: pilus assembly protein, partial [Anaerolineales bacterium]
MRTEGLRTTNRKERGQGLVEFALVLPIFLMLIMGIVEFGRLMFIYNSVATASREAARYGASVGINTAGVEHFRDCSGIRDTAQRLAGFAPIEHTNINIEYDNPATGFHETSCPPSQFELGDRIIVSVSITFEPIVPLMDIPPLPVTSETKRTVLRDVYIK